MDELRSELSHTKAILATTEEKALLLESIVSKIEAEWGVVSQCFAWSHP